MDCLTNYLTPSYQTLAGFTLHKAHRFGLDENRTERSKLIVTLTVRVALPILLAFDFCVSIVALPTLLCYCIGKCNRPNPLSVIAKSIALLVALPFINLAILTRRISGLRFITPLTSGEEALIKSLIPHHNPEVISSIKIRLGLGKADNLLAYVMYHYPDNHSLFRRIIAHYNEGNEAEIDLKGKYDNLTALMLAAQSLHCRGERRLDGAMVINRNKVHEKYLGLIQTIINLGAENERGLSAIISQVMAMTMNLGTIHRFARLNLFHAANELLERGIYSELPPRRGGYVELLDRVVEEEEPLRGLVTALLAKVPQNAINEALSKALNLRRLAYVDLLLEVGFDRSQAHINEPRLLEALAEKLEWIPIVRRYIEALGIQQSSSFKFRALWTPIVGKEQSSSFKFRAFQYVLRIASRKLEIFAVELLRNMSKEELRHEETRDFRTPLLERAACLGFLESVGVLIEKEIPISDNYDVDKNSKIFIHHDAYYLDRLAAIKILLDKGADLPSLLMNFSNPEELWRDLEFVNMIEEYRKDRNRNIRESDAAITEVLYSIIESFLDGPPVLVVLPALPIPDYLDSLD